jgi:CDP-paratose 2-epimerase
VVGVDNNFRAAFFGSEGDTRWTRHRLLESLPSYQHHEIDIRDREAVA